MKNQKLFLPFILIFLSMNLFGQDYSNLKDISLAGKEDCEKAQPKVLECCNYLLSRPCIEELSDLNSIVFVMQWMRKTPDFEFATNENVNKAIKSNDILAGRYYAAISKVAIEKNIKDNSKPLELESVTLFLKYCKNPVNKVKISSRLQKLIDDMNNDVLGK